MEADKDQATMTTLLGLSQQEREGIHGSLILLEEGRTWLEGAGKAWGPQEGRLGWLVGMVLRPRQGLGRGSR